MKNRPAGIARRTRRSIRAKWRPAGPQRWATSLSSRGGGRTGGGNTLTTWFIVSFHSAQNQSGDAEGFALRFKDSWIKPQKHTGEVLLHFHRSTPSSCNLTCCCFQLTNTGPPLYSATLVTRVHIMCKVCVLPADIRYHSHARL